MYHINHVVALIAVNHCPPNDPFLIMSVQIRKSKIHQSPQNATEASTLILNPFSNFKSALHTITITEVDKRQKSTTSHPPLRT